MIKIGIKVRFNYDGMSGEGYVAGRNTYNRNFWSIHVVPEQELHADASGNFIGSSFWNVDEDHLVVLSWEQEDI